MNTYCIKTIETIEHVYRLVAETEDEALALLKTDIFDSEYNFIDEEFKSIEVEEKGVGDA
jgi:hypothetical protein